MKHSNLRVDALMKSSIRVNKSEWTPSELKSPESTSKLNLIFNSVKDIYDKNTINQGIKKLRTVQERLDFINLLLKRREEIDNMEAMAQISKMGPLFERLKQKFMKKINEKKSVTTNRSSLFRKNSVFSPTTPQTPLINLKNNNENETELNNLIVSGRKRGTLLNVVSGFNERKILPKKEMGEVNLLKLQINENVEKKTPPTKFLTFQENKSQIKNTNGFKRSLTQRKGSLGAVNMNSRQINCLQKDLFWYVIKNDSDQLLENGAYSNKNVKSIDNQVKRLLTAYKSSKVKDFKTYFKLEPNFFNTKPMEVCYSSRYKTKFVVNEPNPLLNDNKSGKK